MKFRRQILADCQSLNNHMNERKFPEGFYSTTPNTPQLCCGGCSCFVATTSQSSKGERTLRSFSEVGLPASKNSADTSQLCCEELHWGETGVGELGVGPKRKTGARRGEVWPGKLSAESYAWPRRKAGAAWLRGEKARRAFARAQALGAEPGPRKIAAAIYAWWVPTIWPARNLCVTKTTI